MRELSGFQVDLHNSIGMKPSETLQVEGRMELQYLDLVLPVVQSRGISVFLEIPPSFITIEPLDDEPHDNRQGDEYGDQPQTEPPAAAATPTEKVLLLLCVSPPGDLIFVAFDQAQILPSEQILRPLIPVLPGDKCRLELDPRLINFGE